MNFISQFQHTSDQTKIKVSMVIRSIFLSMIDVYVPFYVLSLGYTLGQVILFYAAIHALGAVYATCVLPILIQKKGVVWPLRLHYPFQIAVLLLLPLLAQYHWLIYALPFLFAAANLSYYLPLNMLMLRSMPEEQISTSLSHFFALPKLFGILGPLISLILLPVLGFNVLFLLAAVGLCLSYIPILMIQKVTIGLNVNLGISGFWRRLWKRRKLYILELIENIVEESEWYWGILILATIGAYKVAGILGIMQSLAAIVFTLSVGKQSKSKPLLVLLFSAVSLLVVWMIRVYIPVSAYIYQLGFVLSLAMTGFMVAYFSVMFGRVKNDQEEEFMVAREVPVVLGRLIVFGCAWLTLQTPKQFIALPVLAIVLLMIVSKAKLVRDYFLD